MDLSRNVIKRFVSVTNQTKVTSNDVTVYGTIAKDGDTLYVQLDGSDVLTPITSSVDVREGDRVLVLIKNREAMVIGSPTSPTARLDELKKLEGEVTEFGVIIADKVGTGELVAIKALIDELEAKDVTITGRLDAQKGYIDDLTAENVVINGKLTGYQADIEQIKTEKLDAKYADITYATIENLNVVNQTVENLEADHGEFKELVAGKFTAVEGNIETLNTEKLSAKDAELEYAKIKNLEVVDQKVENLEGDYGSFKELSAGKFTAVEADIANLDVEKLSAEQADLRYVNIDFGNIDQVWFDDFYAESGIINRVQIGEGVVVKELVGVTIKGDLIEAGTLKADRLVVLGSDGNYYKLSTDFEAMPGVEPVEEDAIHGSVLIANSVTAEKISVHDLVAFDATIGGFKISDNSIYSGVKASADNTTRGIYLDSDGQVAIGDKDNYIKFFKDKDDQWKLDISVVNRVQKELDDMEIGGRNLIRNSTTMIFEDYFFVNYTTALLGKAVLGRMILGECVPGQSATLGNTVIGHMVLREE